MAELPEFELPDADAAGEVPEDDEELLEELLEELVSTGSDGLGLESVTYQPEPLKMMPAGWSSRRTEPPQDGQILSGSSLKRWRNSTRLLHPRHSYS